MGFFDFVGKTFHTIEGVVTDSPIIGSLSKVASMVAHAIPGVGPVIDAAIPAVQAIFSNEAAHTSEASGEIDPALPHTVNLERSALEIKADLQEVGNGIKGIEEED